jgi:hypothetical protein
MRLTSRLFRWADARDRDEDMALLTPLGFEFQHAEPSGWDHYTRGNEEVWTGPGDNWKHIIDGKVNKGQSHDALKAELSK